MLPSNHPSWFVAVCTLLFLLSASIPAEAQ